jgi:MFS family permease
MFKKNHYCPHVSFQAIVICLLAAIFYCYEYYLRVAPSIMSFELKEAYRLSDAGLGFLSAFYYYAYTPLQLPVGMMMDKCGPRKILTLACMLCVIGTYLFAGTEFLLVAQIGRFLVGFGSAFAFVGVLRISASWLPEKAYATMVGLTSLLGMLGAVAGDVVMTFLTEQIGWQSTLYWSALVGIVLALLLWIIIRNHPKKSINTTATTLELPLLEALKTVLLDRKLWLVGMIGCFTYMPLSVFAEMWAVPFLEATKLTREQAAFGSSLVFLGFAIGSPIWGIISDFMGSRKTPIIFGSFLAALSATIIIFFSNTSLNINYALLFSLGFFTSAEVLVFAIGNDNCKKEISATTISFINMVVMLGGMILQPIAGYLLDICNDDYKIALLSLPAGLAIAGFLSLRITETAKL